MRRLPHIVSFLLFIALCVSAAYWAMQLFKPPVRPVAAPPRAAQAEIRPDAAASVFGKSKGNMAVASNYQLRGVIFSGNPRSSVAIISADGKPAQAVGVDKEVVPGVTVKEVYRDYVLLSEGGATKRVELPESAKGLEGIADAPAASRPATPPAATLPAPTPGQPVPTRAQAAAAAQANQAPAPAAPSLPPGQPMQPAQQAQPPQQTQQVLTPQTAPSPPQPVQPVVPAATPGSTGAQPNPATMTTAPPTTVVSPQPANGTAPGGQSLPGVPPGPMR